MLIDILKGFILGVIIGLGLVVVAGIIININDFIGYRKENIMVSLDWFKIIRFFVYALILIFGGLYLLI